jgi:hypothetical protein
MRRRHFALLLVAMLVFTTSASAGSQSASAPGRLAPISESLPTITGVAMVGQTFLGASGSWSGPAPGYAYQWVRCSSAGTLCAPIINATAPSYLETAADAGYTLRLVVSASNKNGLTVSTSNPTVVVQSPTSPPPPTTTTSTSTTTTTPATTTTTTTTSSSSTTTATTTTPTTTTTTTTTTTSTGTLLFKGDFSNWSLGNVHNLSSIAPWSWISDPAPSSPHPPSIVVDPYGSGEHVFAATVDPQDDPGYSGSTRVDMVGPTDSKLARPGLDEWWYVEMAFPSKAVNGAAYVPTNGDWNWNIQWHASAVGKSGTQPFAMGVSTGQSTPLVNCNGREDSNINPQLFYYQDGGTIVGGVKPAPNRVCTLKVITYDHWYKVLTHVKWATDSTGIAETWVDGALVRSITGPTLFKDGSTGAVDTPYLLLGNYRWMGQAGGVNFSSTILYKKARIGTTGSSVLP